MSIEIEQNSIVCLCGSTKFKKEFEEAVWEESLKGKVVLSVCCFTHYDNLEWSDEQLSIFRDLHIKKIDMADEVLVINVGGYIGKSTKEEIEYAKSIGKIVKYKF